MIGLVCSFISSITLLKVRIGGEWADSIGGSYSCSRFDWLDWMSDDSSFSSLFK
jgi:hypothetical protein